MDHLFTYLDISDVGETRQRLSKLLQLHGYSACREALILLEDHYSSSTDYDCLEDFVIAINRVVTFDLKANSSIINPKVAHSITRHLKRSQANQVVEPTDEEQVPKIPEELTVRVKNVQYDRTQTIPNRSAKSVSDKFTDTNSDEFNIHYKFLFTRLSSLPLFQGEFQLTKISDLISSTQTSLRCICFGLLIKDISKIDSYLLIDNTGRVPVRITPDTAYRNTLAYTNCMFIIEGVYINPDDILFAANVGLPPILLDPIPDKAIACKHDELVIVLKELYLDDEDVCAALDMLFTGYNSMEKPPILFILIGNFTRSPCEPSVFKIHMKKLIRILRACDNLIKSHFVFVPGQNDTSPLPDDNSEQQVPVKNTMPKPPLTKQHLPINLLQLSKFESIHLATNPAHIYLGDRLITVVSHSYIKEIHKNLLHDLSDHREQFYDTIKHIILSSGHLSAGIDKKFIGPMNLWHRPDLLVLADHQAFGSRYDYSSPSQRETTFTTLPSFAKQSFQFKVYCMRSGEIDDSQVSLEALKEIVELEPEETTDLD